MTPAKARNSVFVPTQVLRQPNIGMNSAGKANSLVVRRYYSKRSN